jgi:hypothetical protein
LRHHVADDLIHERFHQLHFFVVRVLEIHFKVQVFILAGGLQQIFGGPCSFDFFSFKSLLSINLLHHF